MQCFHSGELSPRDPSQDTILFPESWTSCAWLWMTLKKLSVDRYPKGRHVSGAVKLENPFRNQSFLKTLDQQP